MADPVSAAISAVVAAATTATATLLTAGFTQTVFTTVAQFALRAALFAGANYLLTPQVGVGGSPTDWQADPDAGIPFVVGRRGVAGNIVHRDEWGPDNRYQSFVSVYSAGGPIQSFGTFQADETAVTFGTYGRVGSGTWQDVMWLDTRLGAQPDTALETPADKGDPTVSGAMPEWGSAYKLSGKAASMWTLALDHDRKRYPSGDPRPRIDIEGILGYDPRLDSTYPGGSGSCRVDDRTTYVYSQNPIIGALNNALGYRENGELVGGIGSSIGGIDVAAFVECANIADANGWTVSAHFTTKDDNHQVLLGFLQAGGATYANNAGLISCVSRAAAKTSIVTITAADTAGPIAIDTAASRLTRINTILPKCVLETHQWEMTPLDAVVVSAYVTEDGGARERGIEYPFVSDPVQASQLAAYDVVDSREGITGRVPLKPHMRQLKGGDAFTITEPGFVLDGQKCLVIDRAFDPATSVVTITFRSETDAKHPFALGLNPTLPAAPTLTPVDPVNFPAPDAGDWSAAASTIAGADGVTRPSIVITGAVTNAQVDQIEVSYQYRGPDDGGGWQSWSPWHVFGTFPATTTSIEIEAVPPGAQVQVRINYISIFGQPSTAPLDLDTITVSGQFVSTRAVGSVTQDDIDAALSFLASASPELAAGLATLTQIGALNRIFDPLFLLGIRDNISNTAPLVLVDGDPRAIAAELTVESDDVLDIVFKPRFELRSESRLMAGCEITLSGPLAEAAIQVRFYDADLVEVGTPVEIASAATGARAAGFLEPADIPDGVRWGQLEVVATATGFGVATLQVHEPLAAYAGPNQSVVEAFRDPQDEAVGRIIAKSLVDQARVFEIEGLVYETAVSRAAVLVLQEVTANAARYQISTTYTGADGVDYALVELYAADGISRILQIAGVIAFANPAVGGGVTVAMEIRDAIVHILTELRLSENAALTYYTPDTVDPGVAPDILRRSSGKHPSTGKVGDFLYDETGAPLLEFNATDNTAVLYPAMAADGFVGSETDGSGTSHDLTTASTARVTSDFIPLIYYPDGVLPFIPGAKILLEVDYQIAAEFNSFEWFGFRETLNIEARVTAGSWTVIKAFDAQLKWFSSTSNTGQNPPFLGATTTVTKDFSRTESFVVPASPSYDEVRARVSLAANDLGGGGDCISGSLNDTKITGTLEFSRYRLRISQPRPRLTQLL